jgi:hypothetical protein
MLATMTSRTLRGVGSPTRACALLRGFGLDEAAIDVEAYRVLMADLAAIERRLTELALRRDKIIRQIEDYRAGISAPAGSGQRQGMGRDLGDGERGGEA